MLHRRSCILAIPLILILSPRTEADDFDRLEGPALAAVPARKGVKAHEALSLAQLGNLPAVLQGTRSPLLVVKTDQGNLARVLAVSALRKTPGGVGEPVPVLVLERFATFEAGRATARLARGQDVLLFDGFRFDLDTGQVVPEAQGGDLQFLASGQEGPRLVTMAGATIYSVSDSPFADLPLAHGPSKGRAVLPGDFAGRFRLFANGQWSGSLELKVGNGGEVTGQFRSDLNGSIYPVTGQVSADVPQKVVFSVQYPRAMQEFEGFLWTEGKGAMAGVVSLQGHPYGFFAIREGGHYAPSGDEAGPLTDDADRPGRALVNLQKGDRFSLDGKTLTAAELVDALKLRAKAEPPAWVLLHASPELPYAAVLRAIEAVRAAGIDTIRLASAHATDQHEPE